MFKGKIGYSLNGNEITINKLGHSYKFKLTRQYSTVKNVHITNVYGTYYAYAVVLSKYSELPERSGFENINIDNIFVYNKAFIFKSIN